MFSSYLESNFYPEIGEVQILLTGLNNSFTKTPRLDPIAILL